MYELAFKEFAQENELSINANAFLMPTDGDKEIRLGTASMEIFHTLGDINLHDIEVVLMPCEKMYKMYLNYWKIKQKYNWNNVTHILKNNRFKQVAWKEEYSE